MVCLPQFHYNLQCQRILQTLFREYNILTSFYVIRNSKLHVLFYTHWAIYRFDRLIRLKLHDRHLFFIRKKNLIFTFEFDLFYVRSDNYEFELFQFDVFTNFFQTGIVTTLVLRFVWIFLVKSFLESRDFLYEFFKVVIQGHC